MQICEALIKAPEGLAACRQAKSLPLLLDSLRRCLAVDLSDDALLNRLGAESQTCVDADKEALAQHWFPYHYHSRSRSIQWCLPEGRASEPFHDEYVSRCRQAILLNQLLAPRTSIGGDSKTAKHGGATDELGGQGSYQPAGFIFHLSRWGSTLLSGSLAELEQVSVLSESPLLTELLLDPSLSTDQTAACLPDLVRWQATGGKSRSLKAVVKWNAWDIFQWPLLRAVYPATPVILLVRDPVEILASHQKSAGRHMAGDPSLAKAHSVFAQAALRQTGSNSVLDYRIRVLEALLNTFIKYAGSPGVLLLDYNQLAACGIDQAMQHFQLTPSAVELERISLRTRCHSKEPARQFTSDIQQKQQWFSAQEQGAIRERLLPLYQQLLTLAHPVAAVANECVEQVND